MLGHVKVSFAKYLQPEHLGMEDILGNLGNWICSKIYGKCMTRTCTWTCFSFGSWTGRCLVPTSQPQYRCNLNHCVESFSLKCRQNHMNVLSLLTSTNSLWSFLSIEQTKPIGFIPHVSHSQAVIAYLRHHNYDHRGKIVSVCLLGLLI